MTALAERQDDLARDVVRGDATIDRDELEIDELAMQDPRHPAPGRVRSALHHDGAQSSSSTSSASATSRSRRQARDGAQPPADLEPQVDLAKLAALVQKNLHAAIDRLRPRDADQATP